MKTKEQYRELLEARIQGKRNNLAKVALLGGALIGGAVNPVQAANTPEPRNVNTAQETQARRARLAGSAAVALGGAATTLGSLSLLMNQKRKSGRRHYD